jgi:hypothetical protein
MAKRVVAGIVAGLALAATAATAQAATVHLGSPLTASFVPGDLGNQQNTIVQLRLPEPGAIVQSPVEGHVVSYQLAASKGTFAIQVIRLEGTGARSIGTSATTAVNTTGISAPIGTNLLIRRGDLVGVTNIGPTDLIGGVENGSAYGAWTPPLVDGGDARNPFFVGAPPGEKQIEFGMGATVRYCQVPALKGLTPRVARERLASADCTVGKVTKTKKRRKKKRVVGQSVEAGKAISDTAHVNLKVTRKRHG